MQHRRRRVVPIATLAVLAGVVAAVALGAAAGKPVVVTESTPDAAPNAPDLVRAELQRSADGRLRAALTFAKSVTTKSLVAKSGPPGSVCMRIYTQATPGVIPPDFLVCATPDSKGKSLRGAVMAEQINALPKKVASAIVTRSSQRSVVLRFSQSSVGTPPQIRFAGEATRAGCTRTSCVDTLPDAPGTAKLLVRPEAPA